MTDSYLPKVSIVIPVYNGSDYLSEAIDSALTQTYPNFEIVIVNDGSNDGGATENVARSYGSKVRYFSKPNGGVASALNLAVREMKGEYFSWLSHDDLYTRDKVAREMDVVLSRDDRRTIIYSNYQVFGSSSATTDFSLRRIGSSQFRYWITVENALHGCTLLIPKAAFLECGMFDESLRTTQDYDLWFRMASKFEFIHVPEVLVRARSHSQQGSIKLASTALAECDALLTRFVSELTPEDLASSGENNRVVVYGTLAWNMWRRGYRCAFRRASAETVRTFTSASITDRLSAISFLMRESASIIAKGEYVRPIYGFLKRCARIVLPERVRKIIRSYVGPSNAGVRSSVVDTVRALPLKDKFAEVYERNIFGGAESRSGAGSDLMQTEIIRREIPHILREYSVNSMLDAPCGDWFWMREVDLGIQHYIGADIVDALIERNKAKFGRDGIDFMCLDLSKDKLPKVDLIFSRDCLVHLSFSDASRMLENFKRSGAEYLLTTTFPGRSSNVDLGNGFWRPLNMELPPFNFLSPIKIINEGCTEGNNQFIDKSLGLWRLKDILA